MSKTLEKTDLVRAAWTTALRTQGHRKCEGDLFYDGYVCAMGMLAEVQGITDETFANVGYEAVGAAAGLTSIQVDEVIAMNDGRVFGNARTKAKWCDKPQTFTAIADEVDGWFTPEKPQ